MENLLEISLATLDRYAKRVISLIPEMVIEITMDKLNNAFMAAYGGRSGAPEPVDINKRKLENHIKGLQRAWNSVHTRAVNHDVTTIIDITNTVARDFDKSSSLYNQIMSTVDRFGMFKTPADKQHAAVDVLSVIKSVKHQQPIYLEGTTMDLLQTLLETIEEKSKEDEKLLPIDKIAIALFNKKAGPVKDLKRSKDAEFLGVSHTRSLIAGPDGKRLSLTFDNSTDSGEFEINSLTPMNITRGSDKDKQIKKLYTKHGVESKKKIGYTTKDDDETVVREVHLGKMLSKNAVKFVHELISILKAKSPVTVKKNES